MRAGRMCTWVGRGHFGHGDIQCNKTGVVHVFLIRVPSRDKPVARGWVSSVNVHNHVHSSSHTLKMFHHVLMTLLYTYISRYHARHSPAHGAFTVDVMSKKMISKLLTRYNIVLSMCSCAGSHIRACVRTHHTHARTLAHIGPNTRTHVFVIHGKPVDMHASVESLSYACSITNKRWLVHRRIDLMQYPSIGTWLIN